MEMDSSLKKLSKNAINAINFAYDYAKKNNSKYLEVKHLFLGIINQKDSFVNRALESVNFNSSVSFSNIIVEEKSQGREIIVSEDFNKALIGAFYISRKMGHVYVGTEHLMLSILQLVRNPFVKELKNFGIDYDYFESLVSSFGNYPPGVFSYSNANTTNKNLDIINKSYLSFIGVNLNQKSQESGITKVIGRKKEIDRIIHILSRRNKNNPILIGEAGVGKTSIVENLAYMIHKKEVPENLQNFEIWSLDLSKLMMSTEMRGELEMKINNMMEDIKARKNIILFIDEIHMIFNLGSNGGNNDIANMLKPHLTSDYLRCIGATTFYEYQRFFEGDAALTRRFLPVKIEELSIDDSIKAIKEIKGDIESYHNVKITDDSIVASVNLSDRFIVDRFLPDKAIDLLEESSTSKSLEKNNVEILLSGIKNNLKKVSDKKEKYLEDKKYLQSLYYKEKELDLLSKIESLNKELISNMKEVSPNDIVTVISKWTGIPSYSISNFNLKELRNLDNVMKKEIIGQDNAVDRVSNILKSAKVGFRDENRPLGVFLFVGPTGVGKTELAKQIAIKYIGSKKSLIQIDMSEYMESHSVSKFIGSPPGYVGYQEGGQLTERVKNKPYSVVLFDEIEKAHPEVLNILLQIMEEGHLTDSRGRFVNFKNTVIILTSNIASDIIESNSILGFNTDVQMNRKFDSKSIESEYSKIEEESLIRLKEYLPPEFLNRIDDIIVFKSLTSMDSFKIVKKIARDYSNKMKKSSLNLIFSDEYLNYISIKGFNEDFGARQLKRVFNKYTETSLSAYFIENMIQSDTTFNGITLKIGINKEEKIYIESIN
jgi:ATP-dependent Clp protease ATP-binding subunit ClpC